MCFGRGCAGLGAQHALSPWLAGPVGGCVPRGCCRGWPPFFVNGIWCLALSLLQPLVPQLAPLRAVVARCGCGEEAFPGGAFRRFEGRLSSGAPPPPAAPSLGGLLGSATHVPWARVCRRGGPALSPWPVGPMGTACRGGGGGRLRGGWPSGAARGVWFLALSPPRPLAP